MKLARDRRMTRVTHLRVDHAGGKSRVTAPDSAIAIRRPKQVTLPALIALIAGFALGALGRVTNLSWLLAISSVAKPVGMLSPAPERLVETNRLAAEG